METLLRLALSLLVCVLTSSAEKTFRARAVTLQVDKESQGVKLWAENGTKISYKHGGIQNEETTNSEARWYKFIAQRRGSKYCLQYESGEDNCHENRSTVIIESDHETKWIIEPMTSYSGCGQYRLLELELDVHDDPTKLFWRPGYSTRKVVLTLKSTGVIDQHNIAQSLSQSWFDIMLQLKSDENPCAVTSSHLNVSGTCQGNQSSVNRIVVTSQNDDGVRVPSYFSFDCGNGQGNHQVWAHIFSVALALFLLVALAAVVYCLLRAKVLPCTRETLASNPKDYDSRGIPHGQEQQQEDVYAYMSPVGLRFQDLELPPLTSHDSENSLYGEL